MLQKTILKMNFSICVSLVLIMSLSGLFAQTVPTFFFPFGKETTDVALRKLDDGYSPSIPLGIEFPFFGTTETELYVGSNGVISFQEGVSNFGSISIPDAVPLIAVYWGDVNTRDGGCIYYRIIDDNATLSQITDAVLAVYASQGLADFRATWAFVATYNNVARWSFSAPTGEINNFQVAIATDGTYSFAVFQYCTMEWETGIQGVQVGFDAGDQTHFYLFPTSQTNDILNIGRSTNSGVTGRYVFRIDGTVIDAHSITESVNCIGVSCTGGCCQDDGIASSCTLNGVNDNTCDVNDCVGINCNDGTCVDEMFNYTCSCDAGYSGDLCETNIDECLGVNCNDGTCIDGIAQFTCSCDAGFTGNLCETNIDECLGVNCNDGTCIDGIAQFTCSCDAGFTGNLCETNIDECAATSCNNGLCIDGINGFSCTCNCGWKGEFCDQPKGSHSVEVLDDGSIIDVYSHEDDCGSPSSDEIDIN